MILYETMITLRKEISDLTVTLGVKERRNLFKQFQSEEDKYNATYNRVKTKKRHF